MGEDESEPHRVRDRLSWKLKVYQVHKAWGEEKGILGRAHVQGYERKKAHHLFICEPSSARVLKMHSEQSSHGSSPLEAYDLVEETM